MMSLPILRPTGRYSFIASYKLREGYSNMDKNNTWTLKCGVLDWGQYSFPSFPPFEVVILCINKSKHQATWANS